MSQQQDFLTKPVLVPGASGFMGSQITRQLVAAGRQVRILVRKSSNLQALADLDVEIHYGDVYDVESLKQAMTGCGSVFYNVLDPRFWLSDPAPIFRCNVDGLVNAMEAALATGIERFIFTSTMGTLGQNPNGPVTEDIPFNWRNKACTYILARLEAENRFLQYCHEKGLPGVALCVANTFGPQDFQPSPHGGAVWHVAQGKMKYVLDSAQPTVDIRDAAQAALLAEQHGRLGERYIIANEYIHNRDFYKIATDITGVPAPKLIPRWLAYSVATVAETWCKLTGKKDYLVRRDSVYLSNAFKAMDTTKARTELHWQPRPIKETITDAVAWFKEYEAS